MALPSPLDIAFSEDLPQDDITTDNLNQNQLKGRARLIAKEDLVLSGSAVFTAAMKRFDFDTDVKWQFKDGDTVIAGQTLAIISGHLAPIIKSERVALNFLCHLSGVATLTRCFVKMVEGTSCQILDTRKTLPGLRELQKKAVKDGGGTNHRMSLSDQAMVKENHIVLAGGITEAIVGLKNKGVKPITVEVTNLTELDRAIAAQPDRILLDNFNLETIKQAMAKIPAHIEVEASGNMTLERVKEVAQTGVNFISVGALTHSAPSADISLVIEKTNS